MDTVQSQPPVSRSLEGDGYDEPDAKRLKTSHNEEPELGGEPSHLPATDAHRYDVSGLLPPSLSLLDVDQPKPLEEGNPITREIDVGISEYISSSAGRMEGIIKQRFTDFLVFEVDKSGKVLHLTSLDPPAAPAIPAPAVKNEEKLDSSLISDRNSWDDSTNAKLEPFLSSDAINQLREMYFQGPEPPQPSISTEEASETFITDDTSSGTPTSQGRGRGRGGSGARGGRGGRRGRGGVRTEDQRRVVSELITSKDKRTELHRTIREVFGGKLDTEAVETSGEDGSRIVIKWMGRGRGRGGRGGRDNGGLQSTGSRLPPYIHFTLQKTNRDTQDALSIVARALKLPTKDLSVAGTKDKRGVTTQRVSLKRGNNLTVADVWKAINVQRSRERTVEHALKERGERGVRIGALEYKPSFLELGMLKGNAFLITLRNVKVNCVSTIDSVMESVKTKGFINYYGMQRFGTSAIPTHAIGLAILKSDWSLAVSLILRPRPGENPDSEVGRRAWLEDGDLRRALQKIPRRSIAERCILESYQKQNGESRNAYGALSTIPRNLRLMYVHAYQSYVWNAVVSERIRRYGCENPVVGDLVYQQEALEIIESLDTDVVPEHIGASDEVPDATETIAADEKPIKPQLDAKIEDLPKTARGGNKKEFVAAKVKILEESDLPKYSIFDVVMPLPGRDVSYPGGELGERFKEFLRADGLDPDNFQHAQKDYTLLGSYRKILHLPEHLSWSVLRYTDPDVPLAQSDEDKILGFDVPRTDPEGKFIALQMDLQLGTAAYATMAIREITKMDTSAQSQSLLTQASEDQAYRGSGAVGVGDNTIMADKMDVEA
ncbi:hypothetical protein FRB94_003713 [Tulasnella sp. JGI-2019a]|nr:hypothetical protein FRB94_003713 [Tulasnella sp. JGI-2019a]